MLSILLWKKLSSAMVKELSPRLCDRNRRGGVEVVMGFDGGNATMFGFCCCALGSCLDLNLRATGNGKRVDYITLQLRPVSPFSLAKD